MADVVPGYLYGLRDIKITSLDGATQVDLPAARTLTWSETSVSDELRGDDTIVSAIAFVEGLEWTLEAGGISLEAYALLTGETVVSTGVTPNRQQKITRQAGRSYPYVKVYGRSLGDQGDGAWILLNKVKVNTMEGNMTNQEFYITNCSGTGIKDASGNLYDLIKLETDAALPTS